MGGRRSGRVSLGVVAALLVAVLPALVHTAWAKGEKAPPKKSPVPQSPGPAASPADPKSPTAGDPSKPPPRKKQGDPPVPDPPPRDAGRTAASRAKYLVWLLLDEARTERGAVLSAAQDEGIDAAIAGLPETCPARLRASIAEARRLVDLSNWSEALLAAESALEIDERCLAAHLLAARALVGADRDQDALADHLDAAVAEVPDEPVVWHARGVVRWSMGAGPEATRRDLARARELIPADGRYALTLGTFDLERKAYRDAASTLLAATDARASDAVAWRTLGRAFVLAEDWSGAVAAFERVLQLADAPKAAAAAGPAPVLRPQHLVLALLYADRLQDREKARSHATSFVQAGGVDVAMSEWLDGLLAR